MSYEYPFLLLWAVGLSVSVGNTCLVVALSQLPICWNSCRILELKKSKQTTFRESKPNHSDGHPRDHQPQDIPRTRNAGRGSCSRYSSNLPRVPSGDIVPANDDAAHVRWARLQRVPHCGSLPSHPRTSQKLPRPNFKVLPSQNSL